MLIPKEEDSKEKSHFAVVGKIFFSFLLKRLLPQERCVLWLSLANLYCYLPCKLVMETLVRHFIPVTIRHLDIDHYSYFGFRVPVEGILQIGFRKHYRLHHLSHPSCPGYGHVCKISRDRMLWSQVQVWSYTTTNPGLMNDLTLSSELVPGGRWILVGLEKLMRWMSFKPSKSRSLEKG